MRTPVSDDDSSVKRYKFLPEPVFAQTLKFDYNAILNSRTASLTVDDDDRIVVQDPYSPHDKIRFEHAWRYDPIVRLAINKKVDFIIGERPITVLDTTKEFTGASDAKIEAFNNIVGNNVYQEMKTW